MSFRYDPDAWRTKKNHWTIDEQHELHGPYTFDEWIPWAIQVEDQENFERLCRVARTQIDGDCWVSTVFLRGIDHSMLAFSGKPHTPLLFETMVFTANDGGGDMDRYTTWAEAEAGHQRMVDQVMGLVPAEPNQSADTDQSASGSEGEA